MLALFVQGLSVKGVYVRGVYVLGGIYLRGYMSGDKYQGGTCQEGGGGYVLEP